MRQLRLIIGLLCVLLSGNGYGQFAFTPAQRAWLAEIYGSTQLLGSIIISNTLPPDRMIGYGLTRTDQFGKAAGNVTGYWDRLYATESIFTNSSLYSNQEYLVALVTNALVKTTLFSTATGIKLGVYNAFSNLLTTATVYSTSSGIVLGVYNAISNVLTTSTVFYSDNGTQLGRYNTISNILYKSTVFGQYGNVTGTYSTLTCSEPKFTNSSLYSQTSEITRVIETIDGHYARTNNNNASLTNFVVYGQQLNYGGNGGTNGIYWEHQATQTFLIAFSGTNLAILATFNY